jgi:hypothetical protein
MKPLNDDEENNFYDNNFWRMNIPEIIIDEI